MSTLSFAVNNEREYDLPSGAVIRFDPASPSFTKKFMAAFSAILERYEADEKAESPESPLEIIAELDAREAFVRGQIDSVFGEGTSDAISSDILALADGLPIWANFCMAVIDELDKTLVGQQKEANPRLDKYLSKYQKYRRK